ncbi:MAG: AraC family transcriptional regulator [Bacillota bacterium]|nr:AraC family transcriptional regulator [Bacillota bacterium]
MKDVLKQVAYLQGLADGMELEDSKEGRVISEMLNLLEDMADYIGFLREQQEDMEDYMESIDSDLSDLEDEIYGDEECCCCDEDCDGEDMIDVECPNCHEIVCFDADILEDEDLVEVTCPVCNAVVYTNDEEIEFIDEEEADKEEE